MTLQHNSQHQPLHRRSPPSAPTPHFAFLKKRDACAVCDNIPPCPTCPWGYQCQQIFRSSCQDCPVNKCVLSPNVSTPATSSGSSNGSALGGGLGALLAVAIIGAIGFYFWRKKRLERRKIQLSESGKDKIRAEKEGVTLQLGRKDQTSARGDSIVEEDTEYTQITGVLGSEKEDSLGALGEPTPKFRRRSFGAATHLSRITEGVEEEEEPDENPEQGEAQEGADAASRRKRASTKSKATSVSSSAMMGPRISIGSGTSISGHNIIPIAYRPSAPSVVNADAESVVTLGVTLPSPSHRTTGTPTVTLNSSKQGPIRPTRAPDLNLRLPSDQQNHLPSTPSPLSTSAASCASSSSSTTPVPAAAYEFMSIDPVKALQSSGVYNLRSERHLSTGTVNTINSTHSGSLSYVLSAPQVITPISSEGVRRIQLENGGKAHLFKAPSLKRKDKGAAGTASGTTSVGSGATDPFQDPLNAIDASMGLDLIPPPANRFTGSGSTSQPRSESRASQASHFSTTSTYTLGIPFGDNPFANSLHQRQSQQEGEQDGQSQKQSGWNGVLGRHGIREGEEQVSPMDEEDRSSWLGLGLGRGPTDSDFGEDRRQTNPFADPETRSLHQSSLSTDEAVEHLSTPKLGDEAADATNPVKIAGRMSTCSTNSNSTVTTMKTTAAASVAGTSTFAASTDTERQSVGGFSILSDFPFTVPPGTSSMTPTRRPGSSS